MPPPPPDAARVLARAHGRGVVHRDVTAANLRVDPEGRTWVLDWGLARPPQGGPADPLQTRAGARLGPGMPGRAPVINPLSQADPGRGYAASAIASRRNQ